MIIGLEYGDVDGALSLAQGCVEALATDRATASELVLVGVSRGGIVAVAVLARLLVTAALRPGVRVGMVLLDSPGITDDENSGDIAEADFEAVRMAVRCGKVKVEALFVVDHVHKFRE